ncbi:MAG: hypothetical protein ACI936_003003 [Paraglaciecola sp.]|jgi:hypothetical protein
MFCLLPKSEAAFYIQSVMCQPQKLGFRTDCMNFDLNALNLHKIDY